MMSAGQCSPCDLSRSDGSQVRGEDWPQVRSTGQHAFHPLCLKAHSISVFVIARFWHTWVLNHDIFMQGLDFLDPYILDVHNSEQEQKASYRHHTYVHVFASHLNSSVARARHPGQPPFALVVFKSHWMNTCIKSPHLAPPRPYIIYYLEGLGSANCNAICGSHCIGTIKRLWSLAAIESTRGLRSAIASLLVFL
jgi:hypothetical protein